MTMRIWKNQPLAIASDFAGQIEALAAAPRPKATNTAAGQRIGRIDLVGFMDPDYCGELRRRVLRMAADDSIGAIAMHVDSPGGIAAGVPELSDAVAAAAKAKAVWALAENFLASGSLWAVCGATKIFASPSTLVGSIGALNVVVDDSEMFAQMGVKVLRIASGLHKGVGIPGVRVEDEHVAAFRRRVDALSRMFQAALVRGRRLTPQRVADYSDGDVWFAQQALERGLIDQIATPDDALARMERDFPAVPYAGLAGQAALQQFEQLIEAAAERDDDWDAAERTVAKQYPDLAKAARAEERRRPAGRFH